MKLFGDCTPARGTARPELECSLRQTFSLIILTSDEGQGATYPLVKCHGLKILTLYAKFQL